MQPQHSVTTSELLDKIAEALDIPNGLYEDAVVRYEDVADWLSEDNSVLATYAPRVYTQGSFRLGTVVRPVTELDHYDIDLVCQLDIKKESTTQVQLKKAVGDRLKARSDLKEILEESRRCWNLDYAKNFHMDVLPCIDNLDRTPDGILLTDKQLVHWQKSNPISYAGWFRERMRVVLEERRKILAKALDADVESVPEWQVRTPLQRIVQLLKRHRDIYFANDQDNRPVSIVITTLAARAYANEFDIGKALRSVVVGMPRFIEYVNGRYRVMNPVEPEENFADKWNEKPALREAFIAWMKRAQSDFSTALDANSAMDAARLLSPKLGRGTVGGVARSLGFQMGVDAAALVPARREAVVPALASVSHAQRPTWVEQIIGKVSVQGAVYLANRKRKLWDLSPRPLPKGVALKFKAKTNVRAPYRIHWQVVNTGTEAQTQGQLRGDFYDSEENGDVRWESTKFAGTHWVEAFVIKDETCVARSGRVLIKVKV